jgi:hypothetical protein
MNSLFLRETILIMKIKKNSIKKVKELINCLMSGPYTSKV